MSQSNLSDDIIIKHPLASDKLPIEIRQKIYDDMLLDGSTAVPYIDFISDFFKKNEFLSNDITGCFRCAIYTINYFSTEDPSHFHYHAAREVLKEIGKGELEVNEKARDLLARELVKECNALAAQIIPRELLQENVADEIKKLFIVGKENSKVIYLVYQLEGKLWLDEIFIQHISKIGRKGKEEAQKFSDASKKWYQEYNDNGNVLSLFRMWVDPSQEPYYCRYIMLLYCEA